ncbi:MAG: hypothetical protein ABL931_07870 [Usitatibacteraceae bacterium]
MPSIARRDSRCEREWPALQAMTIADFDGLADKIGVGRSYRYTT